MSHACLMSHVTSVVITRLAATHWLRCTAFRGQSAQMNDLCLASEGASVVQDTVQKWEAIRRHDLAKDDRAPLVSAVLAEVGSHHGTSSQTRPVSASTAWISELCGVGPTFVVCELMRALLQDLGCEQASSCACPWLPAPALCTWCCEQRRTMSASCTV